MIRLFSIFLVLLALPSVAQAKEKKLDWERCAIELMPASARSLVENMTIHLESLKVAQRDARKSTSTSEGLTAFSRLRPEDREIYYRAEDSFTSILIACGHVLDRVNGTQTHGLVTIRLLHKALKNKMNVLGGADQMRASFRRYDLLENRDGGSAWVAEKTYYYVDDVLVREKLTRRRFCYFEDDRFYLEPEGGEVETLSWAWPEESHASRQGEDFTLFKAALGVEGTLPPQADCDRQYKERQQMKTERPDA